MLAMELLWQMLGQVGTLLYTPVFWLAVGLVYLQTRRWARMRLCSTGQPHSTLQSANIPPA